MNQRTQWTQRIRKDVDVRYSMVVYISNFKKEHIVHQHRISNLKKVTTSYIKHRTSYILMIIALDTWGTTDYQECIFENFVSIAEEHPEHTFVFISDNNSDPVKTAGNIFYVKIKRGSLLASLKISSLLKKYKADVFVTARIMGQTKVRQCLVYGNKLSAGSLKKAARIITASGSSKKEIVEKYKIDGDKIEVIYSPARDNFEPLEFDRKEIIKEAYSEGHEFFLISGEAPGTLLNLLKAFSAFKKMQKSGMQLLIASKKALPEEFYQKLKSFRYKEEVKVIGNIDSKELIPLTAAAYVSIYPDIDQQGVLNAMRSHSAVITIDTEIMKEICGDAALYVNPGLPSDIADKMMLLYKDEKLRQQMIDRGKDRVKNFASGEMPTQLWQVIRRITNV